MKKRKESHTKKRKKRLAEKQRKLSNKPKCGLCGATANLTKTECCSNWICDDEDQYVLFSYARNSCYRNHTRQTLCGFHYNEGHAGDWQSCGECRDNIETEMYVYYGTNEYNFEKLENPPDYEPTRCSKCNAMIVLSEGGYSSTGDGYLCADCTDFDWSTLSVE
jgi:ribosomal protein L32